MWRGRWMEGGGKEGERSGVGDVLMRGMGRGGVLEALEEALREIGVEGAWKVEERDPQYRAMVYLCERAGGEGDGYSRRNLVRDVVGNALVSYQLSMKGEDYWWAFATNILHMPLERFVEIYNKRLLRGKLLRLEKAKPVLDRVRLEQSYGELYNTLVALFGRQKTVSFSIKMFGYLKRACGLFEPFPFSIPLPFDSRMARLSDALGVGKAYWDGLSKKVGIPPLHLDSLLWNAMAFEDRSPLEGILKRLWRDD